MLGFYDWALRGGPLPALLGDPAQAEAIFVTGAERWVQMTNAQRTAAAAGWHLSGGGAFASEPPAAPLSIAFPAIGEDPSPAADLLALVSGEGATDPAFLDCAGASFLTFRSRPLEAPQDWVGVPRLDLSLSGPPGAFDLACIVYELRADGGVFVLSSDLQRVRFAQDAPCELRFDRFRLGARRLAAGSRIALQIRILDNPAFQRPPGFAPARVGAITLHLGPGNAGALFLPPGHAITPDP